MINRSRKMGCSCHIDAPCGYCESRTECRSCGKSYEYEDGDQSVCRSCAITARHLVSLEDFENLKKGDFVACSFHRNIPFYNTRFRTFEVYENKSQAKEIILERRNNVYFNYDMFLKGESHLKSIVLLVPPNEAS